MRTSSIKLDLSQLIASMTLLVTTSILMVVKVPARFCGTLVLLDESSHFRTNLGVSKKSASGVPGPARQALMMLEMRNMDSAPEVWDELEGQVEAQLSLYPGKGEVVRDEFKRTRERALSGRLTRAVSRALAKKQAVSLGEDSGELLFRVPLDVGGSAILRVSLPVSEDGRELAEAAALMGRCKRCGGRLSSTGESTVEVTHTLRCPANVATA